MKEEVQIPKELCDCFRTAFRSVSREDCSCELLNENQVVLRIPGMFRATVSALDGWENPPYQLIVVPIETSGDVVLVNRV